MSYISRENAYRGGAAVGLTGLVAVAFGRAAIGLVMPVFGLGPAPSTVEIHRQLIADPVSGPIVQTINEKFPTELGRIEHQVQSRMRTYDDYNAIAKAVRTEFSGLYRQHLPDLAQAPHANLTEVAAARLDLINELHADSPSLCAAFGAGKVSPSELPEGRPRELLIALSQAEWRGMAAGRDTPAGRRVGPLSPTDAKALVAAMSKDGTSRLEMETFARGQINDAGVDIACGATYHALRAVSTLPEAQRDRVVAAMIAPQAS